MLSDGKIFYGFLILWKRHLHFCRERRLYLYTYIYVDIVRFFCQQKTE